MKIALVGGTGKEGKGLAKRWARAGHEVFVGSRNAERGEEAAQVMSEEAGAKIAGGDNAWAVAQGEVVLLAVPYGAHKPTLESLKEGLSGKIVIDITVPLQPPKVREVHLPEGQSAALEGQALLGDSVKLVATLHHVSSVHLSDIEHPLGEDVLYCTDHRETHETVEALLKDLGARPIDAGPLRNAIALESLTPVLLHINKRYKAPGAGLAVSGLELD